MTTISDLGEKKLIAEFIRPLFNPEDDVRGVGDDCAMVFEGNDVWLFSTDRVPADLIAFRLGLINHRGLGRYLATLNLSDLAACGGRPIGLLLNLGLPGELGYEEFQELCRGFQEIAAMFDCRVLGGDITHSRELSISATSIGKGVRGRVLTRRGAMAGDTLFCSRPVGMTPAAFAYLLMDDKPVVTTAEVDVLVAQFKCLLPLVDLGWELAASTRCSSCMDNTDGLGQSFLELGLASRVACVIEEQRLRIPTVVEKIASQIGVDPMRLAFGAGADFSLIGSLKGTWGQGEVGAAFGNEVLVIGHVEEGVGVFLDREGHRAPLEFTGWNYFVNGKTNP